MILNRLTTLRKGKRWSLQYTADRLGIAKSTYAGYESGHRRPSLEAIKLMADIFDTSTDYLLGRVDDPVQKSKDNSSVELTHPIPVDLCVDGAPLTEEEVHQFIAFVRAKRDLESKKK